MVDANNNNTVYSNNRFTLIQLIVSSLLKAEFRRLNKQLSSIIKDNNNLNNRQYFGFLYNGTWYSNTESTKIINSSGVVSWERKAIHDSLYATVYDWEKDRSKVLKDSDKITQIIHILFSDCVTYQDMRNALPECLVPLLDDVKGIPKYGRTAPEAYTILDNPRKYKQYLKILPTIEFYSVARMLY